MTSHDQTRASQASLDALQRDWSVTQSPPDDLPVTLAQLRQQVRIIVDETQSPATSDQDTELELYGEIATRHVEDATHQIYYERTVTASRDNFARTLYLPMYPVQSVTSVEYRDTDGNTQTVDASNYRTDLSKFPARIVFNSDYAFPSTDEKINAVTVTVTAGYGTSADIPFAIKGAILLHAATLFEHRESVIVGTTAQEVPHTLERLLWPYRLIGV